MTYDSFDSLPRLQRRRDPEIHRDVRAELSIQSPEGRRSVQLSVRHGVVSLTGLVESYSEKWAIDRAVRQIVGVREVRDGLHVRPADGAAATDQELATAANSALHWDARVPNGVHANLIDGMVQLRGAVDRFHEREAAVEAVRNLVGVRDIVNEIALRAATPLPNLALEVKDALRRRLGPAALVIVIKVADGVVTLRGPVPTIAIAGEIENVVRSIRGVIQIHNQLRVF